MTYLTSLLRSLDLAGPPLTNDGLSDVLAAHNRRIVAFIEDKAERMRKAARDGLSEDTLLMTRAIDLDALASDLRAGMHEEQPQ